MYSAVEKDFLYYNVHLPHSFDRPITQCQSISESHHKALRHEHPSSVQITRLRNNTQAVSFRSHYNILAPTCFIAIVINSLSHSLRAYLSYWAIYIISQHHADKASVVQLETKSSSKSWKLQYSEPDPHCPYKSTPLFSKRSDTATRIQPHYPLQRCEETRPICRWNETLAKYLILSSFFEGCELQFGLDKRSMATY